MEVVIRKARQDDVETVFNLAERYVLKDEDKEGATVEGFLVANFNLEKYRLFVNKADMFYVLEIDKKIVGFILAATSETFLFDQLAHNKIREINDQSYVLIKQICVDIDYKGRGYGQRLYQYVMDKSSGRNIYAAIVLEPENTRSVHFHESLDFFKYFEYTPDDERKRGLWMWDGASYTKEGRKLKHLLTEGDTAEEKAARISGNFSVLLHQYESALDLYKHEDRLNWQKLNNMLYVNAAIGALLGFIVEKPSDQKILTIDTVNIVLIASFAGFVVSLGFWISIWCGIHYMQARKRAVTQIERVLVNHSGFHLVTPVNIITRRSLTTYVLLALPLIFTIGWLVMFFVILFSKANGNG